MPCTLTFLCPKDGSLLDSDLQRALKLLDSAGVKVEAAAQIVNPDTDATATILLQHMDDKPRALWILEEAGILFRNDERR